jgi:CheY-like chemotaxis protein
MPTILVVDDDVAFLNDAEQMLTRAGYGVLCATTGAEAVDHLEKRHAEINLAIIDLSLPDTNGFELIGAISRRTNDIRVLATTAVYRDTHLDMAGSLGANAAIRKPPTGKPIPEREWLKVIRQLIGESEQKKQLTAAQRSGSRVTEPTNGTESSR